MDPPTSDNKALALHFSKDLGSETQIFEPTNRDANNATISGLKIVYPKI